MKKIKTVQLQRELRDQAYRKYKGKTLAQEVAAVRQSLHKKGLDRLFEKPDPAPEKANRTPTSHR